MDWSKGYSASYYMSVVDPVTWSDGERIEITSASVAKSENGLRESADVTCVDYALEKETWIRVWLDAQQNQDVTHNAMFTGLATSPTIKMSGTLKEYPLECYSVLKPAEDVLLQRGWYVARNSDGAEVVKDLLSVTPAPVEIRGISPKLQQAIIAEDGESNLSMADKVLDAINWRMRIEGDGTIVLCETSLEPVAKFGVDYDVIETDVEIENDWFGCPNVMRVVSDDKYAVARDEDAGSFLSVGSRGREVWSEQDVDLNDGETIAECAARLLKEAQKTSKSISYNRRFEPDVFIGDRITLNYPGHGLDGDYTVISQSVELGYGVTVSEEVQSEG